MSSPPPGPAADPLIGRVLDGRYRIEAFLARGGMATIYRGVDLRLDRSVAVKVMHPTFAADPGFVERFEREARAAARLNSQYVVAVHDQGNDAGVTYLVMEYVPGHTVRDVMRTHGALEPAQALAIIDPVLEALSAAHRAGYVHRDIKPENVLISDDGRVKVTDFGLARAIEGSDSAKTNGLLLGTVAYLSPEQVDRDHADARSDVYSAGILLFEMVTGQVPFSASAPMQVAYKHVHEDVPAPSSIRPGIPRGVDDLVVHATRRNPDERYPHAQAFLAAVREQRAVLPAAQSWVPAPHDTLVVERTAGGHGGTTGAVAGGAAAGAAGAALGGAAGAADGAEGPGAGSGGPGAGSGGAGAAGAAGALGAAAAGTVGGAAAAGAADSPATGRSGDDDPIDAPSWVNPQAHPETGSTSTPAPTSAPAEATPTIGATSSVAPIIAATGLPAGPAGWDSPTPAAGYDPHLAPGESHITTVSHETAADAGRPTRHRGRWLALVALICAVGVVGLLFALQRVTVPELVGRTTTEAQALLGPAGLKLDSDSSAYSEEIPKGKIIETSPAGGAKARSGSTVRATVSKGPERYDVPSLKGLTVDEAEVALGAVNLTLGSTAQSYSDSVKKGQIISSDPKAGTSVKRDTAVDVTVSKGREPVTVPKVAGTSADAATRTLTDLGLKVDRTEKFSEKVARNVVISSDPKAGATALKGDTVEIVVSKGPPLVTVPNVVRMSSSEARAALEAAGFTVTVQRPAGFEFFGVSDQNPNAGTKAPKGSNVTITVV